MPLSRKQQRIVEGAPRADLVVQSLTGASRAIVRGMFDAGCVSVDGTACPEAGRPVQVGSTVSVVWDPQCRYKENPHARTHRSFRVVYEDPHLIVVEKAAGVLSVPTARHEKDTLVHAVAQHFSKGREITRRAHVVHRLDFDTSGLLVFARSIEVCKALKLQFAHHSAEREYLAIVAGDVAEDKGTFRSYLATDEDLDQYSTDDEDQGKLAVTHYEVVQRLRGATYVRVRLETGRRNQIRVHFSEAGHPVLGDLRYCAKQARHPLWRVRRLALHATTLGFVHPVGSKKLRFQSELPAPMAAFLEAASRPAPR
jgi:23S rRNA pseudouridine1911/1915/1917 synthase